MRCTVTSPSSAWRRPSPSPAMRPTRRSPKRTHQPTCWWSPRSTRASACRWSRRWRPDFRWWRSTREPCPKCSVVAARSCPPRTRTRWRPPCAPFSATRSGARPWRSQPARRLAELDMATAADRFASLRRRDCSTELAVRAVHQFVPTLHRGDAVGRHTLRLRDAWPRQGRPLAASSSRRPIRTPPPSPSLTPTYADVASPGDVLVYQLATASGMAAWLGARNEVLVVNYHNVTPPEHYAPWDNALALHQLRAQAELGLLAPRAALAVTDSRFDEEELRRAGYVRTAVVPPGGGPANPRSTRRPTSTRRPAPARSTSAPPASDPARGARWVSVGRIAPNKALQYADRRAPRGPPPPRRARHARHRRPPGRAGVPRAPCAATPTSSA